MHVAMGPRSPACGFARDRTWNRGGENSEGWESQESTGGRSQSGQGWVRRRTDSRGEQSFEAGVPAANRRAQYPWEGDGTCGTRKRAEATGLATARNRRPGSCVPGPPSGGFETGKESARANGESGREDPAGYCAGGSRTRNPQGRNGPRERVQLPGKGKLWRDAPGTRAVWKKTAKRRGPRQTARAARFSNEPRAARTVERGKNPEDGTGGSMVTPVPHVRPKGSACGKGAPGVKASVGARTPREADPQALERSGSFSKGPARRRGGRAEAKPEHSGEAPNPTREERGALVPRQGTMRNTPRPSKRRGGSAGSQ